MKHNPKELGDLKKLRKEVVNVNDQQATKIRPLVRLAIWITERVGSMGFFMIIFAWTASWLSWNMFSPPALRFDPFPAFVLWLFVSNMLQIFLMPLIMIGQNIQSGHAEARAEADFEVNTKAEREIETVLQHLENQNEMIIKILRHAEKQDQKDQAKTV